MKISECASQTGLRLELHVLPEYVCEWTILHDVSWNFKYEQFTSGAVYLTLLSHDLYKLILFYTSTSNYDSAQTA